MMGKAPSWSTPFRQRYNQPSTVDDGKGTIRIPKGLQSGELIVADNAVGSITPATTGGIIAIWAKTTSAFPQPAHAALIAFDVGTSLQNVKLNTNLGNIDAVSGAVTGTTGTDGNTTVGLAPGTIQIENRQGSVMTYGYLILASS